MFDPSGSKPALPHGGTYNANPISMTAGLKAMEMMTPAAFERLHNLGEKLRQSLREVIARLGINWQMTGQGSLFQLHARNNELVDYRSSTPSSVEASKLADLHRGLLDWGIFMSLPAFGCVSTVMNESEIATMAEKTEDTLREIEGLK